MVLWPIRARVLFELFYNVVYSLSLKLGSTSLSEPKVSPLLIISKIRLLNNIRETSKKFFLTIFQKSLSYAPPFLLLFFYFFI